MVLIMFLVLIPYWYFFNLRNCSFGLMIGWYRFEKNVRFCSSISLKKSNSVDLFIITYLFYTIVCCVRPKNNNLCFRDQDLKKKKSAERKFLFVVFLFFFWYKTWFYDMFKKITTQTKSQGKVIDVLNKLYDNYSKNAKKDNNISE